MEEIDLIYFEEHFDEIMSRIENGESFLLRPPDGTGILLLPQGSDNNQTIKKMKKEKLIKKFK